MAEESGLEQVILQTLGSQGEIPDSVEFAKERGFDHKNLDSVTLSLHSTDYIVRTNQKRTRTVLAPEARGYLEAGATSEVQFYRAVPDGGASVKDLQKALGEVGKSGFPAAKQLGWVALDKGTVLKQVGTEQIHDSVLVLLQRLAAGEEPSEQEQQLLKKRKLTTPETWTTFHLAKGPKFALKRKELAIVLTSEMLKDGSWKDKDFKPYNFHALGVAPTTGSLHPLLKVRSQFRKIFIEMGFEEMATNNYVESSFWNFDALFQPQQHPARDAHDTFFITHPSRTPLDKMPADYVQRVKATHQTGDFGGGSTGYGSPWKETEAEKNLLRTHTTAVSSRMLYKLAQSGFKPAKYFSIDRVFRNEAIDRTHLAEFHQIEGVICDRGMNLQHLMGVLEAFYKRLGLEQIRFKPAYNPYTEPSMEIFGYSPELEKWMELGNSGMFRPEMLLPMGLPPDVRVIAFGLGLERPTMILNRIDNIRDLFGHKVSLAMVKKTGICRLGW